MGVVLRETQLVGKLRQQHEEDVGIGFQQGAGKRRAQEPRQLGQQALGGHLQKGLPVPVQCAFGAGLGRQVIQRGKAQAAQDAQGILPKARVGVAHAAQHPVLQIVPAVEGVAQALARMIGHGVDGKVAPGEVLPEGAHEGDTVGMPGVGISRFGAKGGDFIQRSPQGHRDGAVGKPRGDGAAVGKQGEHLLRQGVGA